jgi:tetratricopeptide (TPR) repeat protein
MRHLAQSPAIDDYIFADAYNNRGAAYSKLERYERALEDFKKPVKLNPNEGVAQKNRERALSRLEGQQTNAVFVLKNETEPFNR